MKKGTGKPADRRNFLKATAAASAGAAATVLLPETAAALTGDERPETPAQPKGYRVTQHVLDYYRSAKL